MISYLLLRFMIAFVSIIPFRALYILSDLVFIFIFYVSGYRRKVVVSNLRNSFPEKSDQEIRGIAKKFYHHLCDISLESIKGFSMSREEIIKRHKILNPDLAQYFYSKHTSVITVPGHYNNWEWGSLSPGIQIQYPIVGFYKPMSNKHTDQFGKKHRSRFGTTLRSIRYTADTFEEFKNTPTAYIMAADQSPSNLKDCYWINFLNRETAWLHGPEKYARKYNLPVIFVDIQKVKRGYYTLKLVTITEDPSALPEGEITRQYAKHLETLILSEPAYWLWSHKRWKHTKQESV